MPFNDEKAEPAQEFKFSRKTKYIISPSLYFLNLLIVKNVFKRNQGLNLDTKFILNDQINGAMIAVGLLR